MTHAYVPNAWPRHDRCDAKVDEDGRARTCGEPAGADVHVMTTPAPAKKPVTKAQRRR